MEQTYLARFDSAVKITRGMSGDEKYRVEKSGVSYLLRVSSVKDFPVKQKEYAYLQHLNQAGLPVPQCICLECVDDKVFTLLSWIEGEEAEQVLPKASAADQYSYGRAAGKILLEIHKSSPCVEPTIGWYDRYFAVIEPRLQAFRKEGIPFDGCENILAFVEENKDLMKTRTMCRHHGDYHMGNLIIRGEKLWVIDWHTVDFDSIGDPWYEFNRLGVEYPMFARGQIDGYFNDQVPEEFWKLFALYFAVSALTSIVWAKHWASHELDNIMALNKRVITMFDSMKNPIPDWYRT